MSFHSAKRKLTEPEKAFRESHCSKSEIFLGGNSVSDVYEVDHIEQQCIRNNQKRRNLQALCPKCHRRKTVEDRCFGDGLFEEYAYNMFTCRLDGSNVKISSYFDNSHGDTMDYERGYEKI